MKDVPSRYDVRLGIRILGTCKRKTGDLGWLFTFTPLAKWANVGLKLLVARDNFAQLSYFWQVPERSFCPTYTYRVLGMVCRPRECEQEGRRLRALSLFNGLARPYSAAKAANTLATSTSALQAGNRDPAGFNSHNHGKHHDHVSLQTRSQLRDSGDGLFMLLLNLCTMLYFTLFDPPSIALIHPGNWKTRSLLF